ncbi:MAG: NADH-quinone oxidoreductase subunit C [Candidatus Cloacimonadota bacterium]|nr:NADH-quinone oxidoreductase subunit C [Candidatus Cloacimonadota bacterium]
MENFIEKLKKLFSVTNVVHTKEKQVFLTVEAEKLPLLLTHLRDYENFTHFAFLTAVDWKEEEKFQLTYMLHNYNSNSDIGIRVFLDRQAPEMVSIHHLWKQVSTYQRELYEMFGIQFPGSPEVEEPMILEGWQEIPPMRREFDTKKYSEETYFPRSGRTTHDPKKHMKKKLYPEWNPILNENEDV